MTTDMFGKILNSDCESNSDSCAEEENGTDNIVPCPENLVALDCEMVGVGKHKRDSLARCSIVSYHGKILYNQYIKPKDKVTDFRTKWSGILPNHLDEAIPFELARKQIIGILNNKIVVGHALHYDLKILKIRRASHHLRDTAKFTPLRRLAKFRSNQTPSLRNLSKILLNRDIQFLTHCSIEDAVAAMDLYRFVESEWENEHCKPEVKLSKSVYFDDSFWPEWLHA